MLITSSVLVDLILFALLSVWLLYKYLSRNNDYWAKRGVPFDKPKAFLGNAEDVFFLRETMGDWLKKIFDSSDDPYSGFFVIDQPHLIIRSPKLIKQILIKDFHYFTDRTIASPDHNQMMQNFMFLQKNPQWKETRAKITQVFSTGRIKGMFPIMKTISEEFVLHLKQNAGTLDAKRVLLKYGTEITARCFFGIRAHSFDNDNADFNVISREMFGPSMRNGIAHVSYFFKQNFVQLFHLEFVSKRIQDYLREAFWLVMKQREESGTRVNDLVDILSDIIKSDDFFAKDKDKVIGNVLQFYVGGYETTSTTISFALYEMAVNMNIQKKVREEIVTCLKKHQTFTYESLQDLSYLDMIILETLRKYPILPFLDRRCNSDYKVPGTDLTIEKGVPIYIPVRALHLSEKYFTDPYKFDPERFSDKNEYNKDGLVYMPFGSGPRVCIGERFGFLSTKLALATILSNIEVSACPQTPKRVEYDPKSFLTTCKGGLPVNFTPLSGY